MSADVLMAAQPSGATGLDGVEHFPVRGGQAVAAGIRGQARAQHFPQAQDARNRRGLRVLSRP